MLYQARVECLDCGAITKAAAAVTAGSTALGGRVLARVATYRRRMPDRDMARALAAHDGIEVCSTTVRSARFASTRMCRAAVAAIPPRIAAAP